MVREDPGTFEDQAYDEAARLGREWRNAPNDNFEFSSIS
jgi:hypothetical protein